MVDVQTAETVVTTPPLAAWVDAPVNYLADPSIKPVTYNPPHGTGVPRRDGNYRDFRCASTMPVRSRATCRSTVRPSS